MTWILRLASPCRDEISAREKQISKCPNPKILRSQRMAHPHIPYR